jgi:hypothetical protein
MSGDLTVKRPWSVPTTRNIRAAIKFLTDSTSMGVLSFRSMLVERRIGLSTKQEQLCLSLKNYYLGGSRLENERAAEQAQLEGRTRLFTRRKFELVGHTNQVSQRFGLHLLHDVAPVDFYGGLAGSDFEGDLLIELSGNHERQNLLFSRS